MLIAVALQLSVSLKVDMLTSRHPMTRSHVIYIPSSLVGMLEMAPCSG